MLSRRGTGRLATALTVITLLASCRSSEPPRATFEPVASEAPTATAPPSTVAPAVTAPSQWSARPFAFTDSAGSTRMCIELTISSTVATTCLRPPDVSSWTVADAHFVVGAGDIALTDGTVLRADASGVAVGVLPPHVVPTTDAKDRCERGALAHALAEHYPESTASWVPSRCAGGTASVSAMLADRTEVIALVAQSNDGHWEVFATFRPPVRCALLDVRSRDLCKLLRYSD